MLLLKRKTILAAAEETTAYTAETLASGDSDFNLYDVATSPTVELLERRPGDGFSPLASVSGLQSGQMSFRADFHGAGDGTAPGWADLFLPACGFVKTVNTFAPVSAPPYESGSDLGVRTLTMGAYEDGRLKQLRGAMGNFRIMLETGKPAMVDFNYTGAWTGASDATLPSPTYPTQKPLRFAASTFTIGGTAVCVQSVTIDVGNEVVLRECQSASDASGFKGALVTNRTITITVNPEADLVANYDPHGDWEDGTERALSIVLSDASDTVTIAIPKAQVTSCGEGDRNGIRTDEITFQANRSSAVDDEMTIAFSAT
jgi:hypothetical protein